MIPIEKLSTFRTIGMSVPPETSRLHRTWRNQDGPGGGTRTLIQGRALGTSPGIVNRPIVPVFNQAFYLHKGIPVWDNPRLVLSDDTAAQLSKTLGDKIACQMRGHGSVVVGDTP